MATINFSVPDELKREFLETFAGENKSALLTGLMQQAIEEKKLAIRRTAAIDALLALRQDMPSFTEDEVRAARHLGRP